jgi:hypothetical protein
MRPRMKVLSSVLLVCVSTIAVGNNLKAGTVFSDDFEDGDISDWTVIEEGSGEVVVELYPGPDWSLNTYSPSGTSSRAQATSPTFEMVDSLDYHVSLEFAFETPIHWIEVFRNRDINTVIDDCPGDYCTFRCRYGGSNYVIDNLFPYTSYSIDYDVHPGIGTYDVYVGGIFKRTCECDPSVIPFPRFRIGDVETGSSNYGVAIYDDFVITQASAGVGETNRIPATYRLSRNQPNPFETVTTITFDLPRACLTDLSVYDVRGRLVRNLAAGTRTAGSYSVTWTGEDETGSSVGPGIYFVRLQAGDQVLMRKIAVAR